MPDCIGGSDRAAGVSRSRWNIDSLERRAQKDLPIGDAVERAPARQAEVLLMSPVVQIIQDMEDSLLIHRLEGGGQILMSLSQSLLTAAGRSKALDEFVRKDRADYRGSVIPRHRDSFGVMQEIIKVEGKAALRLQPDNRAHRVQVLGLPVRRKPHDLVFISISGEPEILGHGQVEQTQGMRK